MRIHNYRFPEGISEEVIREHGGETISGCSITTAKKLLRKYGGEAWTEHFDRDGSFFESSPIYLKGNNSNIKYNRHL